MNSLMKVLAVTAFVLTPFMASGAVSAQTATCAVGFTGPDSKNMCVSTTTYNCSVTNENDVSIVNETGQVVATGTATASGNTTGGSAMTGSATNSNGTNFVVSVTNERVCTAVVTIPATVTPEPPVVPTVTEPVGMGAAGGGDTGGGGAGAVAVLPRTSGNQSFEAALWISGSLLAAAMIAVGSLVWYKQYRA